MAQADDLKARPGLSGGPPRHITSAPPAIPDHELIRRIGGGSYGEVWLARNIMGTYRAVKIVYRKSFANERPFEREFRGIQKFEPISRSHESQVDILHIGRGEDCFYYVMELADDAKQPVTSSSVISKPVKAPATASPNTDSPVTDQLITDYSPKTLLSEKERRGRLPFDECLEIGLALTTALAHLHKNGLVHRDVKPSNVIFVNGIPKLADIGLVTDFAGAVSFVGTEGFLPPEGPGTPQADIFSLGKVLYEISTGKDRQDFPEPPTLLEEFPDREQMLELGEIIKRACARDVGQRYATAESMHADLLLLKTGKSLRRTRLLERRLAVVTRVGIAAGLVALLAVGSYVVAHNQARRAKEVSLRETKLRQQAEAQELASRQRSYASDMNLAQQALAVDNLGRAQELLDRHRPTNRAEIANTKPTIDLRRWEWRYLWQQCRGDPYETFGHLSNAICSLAVSHDGRWLAVEEDSPGGLTLWDFSRRQEVTHLASGNSREPGWGRPAAFSPTAPLLAFCDAAELTLTNDGHKVCLWDGLTQQVLRELSLDGWCKSLAFSGDGRTLVTFVVKNDKDSQIILWGLPEGTRLTNYPASFSGNHAGSSFAVARDMSLAAYAMRGGRIRVVELSTGKELWTTKAADDLVTALAFSPDGKILASGPGYVESGIRLWDVALGKEVRRLEGHQVWIAQIVFSPDGKTLLSASGDQTIRFWDVSEPANKPPPGVLRGHHGEVFRLALLPDQTKLVSGSKDGSIYIWDIQLFGRERISVKVPMDNNDWSFAADSKSILGVNHQGQLARWKGHDFEQMEPLGLTVATNLYRVRTTGSARDMIRLSSDGQLLAHCSTNGKVEVWDVPRGRRVGEFAAHHGYPVQFLDRGKRLVILDGGDKLLHEWELATAKELRSWEVTDPGGLVIFSGDERSYSTVSWRGASTMREVFSGREILPNLDVRKAVDAAYSPDSKFFAVASNEGYVRVWEPARRMEVATLGGYMLGVGGVTFSSDSKRLATAGSGREAIKLWDMDSLQEVLTLGAEESFVCASFSPDGNILGALDSHGLLHCWRAPSWAEIEAVEQAQAASSLKKRAKI